MVRQAFVSVVLVHLSCLLLFAVAASGASGPGEAQGRTFYVDFDGGSDAADGLSAGTSFKRCPGDPAAEGNSAKTTLRPGDIVLFKGGVTYRGNIVVKWSGTEAAPIAFIGDGERFGKGRAIIDGSDIVTGWQQCRTAADCAGNANFRSIYRAQLEPIEPLAANVYQGDNMCWPAQHPNPADPFYQDRSEGHRKIGKATADSVSDPEVFYQPQKDAWDGAWLIVYASPNYPYFVRVTGYDPAANRVTHSGKLTNPTSYAVLNSLRILDKAGEYVIRQEDGRTMIYLWPHSAADLLRSGAGVSRRGTAFVVHGQKHIDIRGFTIQKFAATEHTAMGLSIVRSDSVVFRDNDVRFGSHGYSGGVVHGAAIAVNQSNNVLIEGNRITDNRRCSGILANPAQRLVVRDNLVRRSGYVGIWLMNVARAEIVGNTVHDNHGVHSNGISIYADSSDILVAGNRVYNADRPFTLQDSTNVAVINNAFVSGTTLAVGLWGGKPQRKLLFLNNLILGPEDQGLYAINKDVADCIFQNNIIGSLSGEAPIDAKANTFRNNIYLSSRQRLFHDSELRVVAINHLFVDHARNDFRLRNSPAVNGGADPSPLYPRDAFPDYDFDKDLDANPRKQGAAVDIGPYEFTPASRR